MLPFSTLPGLFRHVSRTYDAANAFNYPQGNSWIRYSHAEFSQRVRHLSLALSERGIGRGETVGLIAPPSPDWIILDLAIQIAGGVTVPIFKKISVESFTHEIEDSGMKLLFAGNPDEIPLVHEHAAERVEIVTFWYSGSHEEYDRLFSRGREIDARDPRRFDELVESVGEDDLATIIYTSGSTGLPKGVELSQRNIVSQINGAYERFPQDGTGDRYLSMLPLAHVFERMVMYFHITCGVPVFFVDDPKRVGEYFLSIHPSVVTVVPRVLEKVFSAMQEARKSATGLKGLLMDRAFRRAEQRQIEGSGGRPTDAIYELLVYPRLRESLGGRLRYVVCGSSKLQTELARFFINIGVPIYEGYGLTEASPVITANAPGMRKLGTVGRPFPDVEVTVSDDGEILARGPNVMRGYHRNAKATAKTIDEDGWLHTGDLGSVDQDGYLAISGRKKELFKKSTGEYVPPVPIEFALSQIPFVDTAVIFADNRTYVTALLFPNTEQLKEVKDRYGVSDMTDRQFLQSDFLHRKTQEYVEEINRHRHHCERIERFQILEHAASIETGELTPTLKVRRFQIEQKYHDLIEQMYRDIGGWK